MPKKCPRTSKVLTLLEENQEVESISRKTGVPERTIYDIRKRHIGQVKAQRSRRQRLEDKKKEEVAAFRKDPESFLKEHATTYSFTLLTNLLRDCTDQVFFQPIKAELYVLLMIDYLEVRWRSSTIAFAGRFRCLLVQAICINGARLRQIGDMDGAWKELARAEVVSGRCIDCLIDIERRRGYVAIGAGNLIAALAHAEWAIEAGGSVHDLHGQPLEKCLAAKATVLYYLCRYVDSYEIANAALSTTDPNQVSLVSQLLIIIAWDITLLPNPDTERAHRILCEISSKYDLSEPSVVRAKVRWLLAAIEQVKGEFISSDRNFQKSLSDFIFLEMPAEVTLVTVDRLRFDGSLIKLTQTYSLDEATGVYKIPLWLESMRKPLSYLRKAVQQARSRRWYSHYCLELREFLGGSSVLPIPSRPLGIAR